MSGYSHKNSSIHLCMPVFDWCGFCFETGFDYYQHVTLQSCLAEYLWSNQMSIYRNFIPYEKRPRLKYDHLRKRLPGLRYVLDIIRIHDDVIKWKHFPRYWPFVRGIHRSPVNSPHKGQWRGALMFTLVWARINGWVNNREADDLRRYRTHYDVIVMSPNSDR